VTTQFFLWFYLFCTFIIFKKKFWPSTSTSKIEISSGFFGPRASYRLSGSALDSRLDPRGQSSTSTSILAPRVFSSLEQLYYIGFSSLTPSFPSEEYLCTNKLALLILILYQLFFYHSYIFTNHNQPACCCSPLCCFSLVQESCRIYRN
jgi:hypothetical protein